MKYKVLKEFSSGSRKYKPGDIVELNQRKLITLTNGEIEPAQEETKKGKKKEKSLVTKITK
jgi:hypothetical protein